MDTKEKIQEDQYDFPYHYLTSNRSGNFSMHEYLQWGLVHLSYIEFLKTEIVKENPSCVLDAGCGDGRVLYELEKELSGSKLVGIDISERAIYFAKGFTKRSDFHIHDILIEPTEDKFNMCISIEVIEHIPPQEISNYVKNIANSLVPGGKLIITTPTTNIPTSRKHYQHFTEETLTAYISEYFEITEVIFQNYQNSLSNLLSRILANKFFIINHKKIRNMIYRLYIRKCFDATPTTGSRIYIKAIKKV